jgi:hypothetical protein
MRNASRACDPISLRTPTRLPSWQKSLDEHVHGHYHAGGESARSRINTDSGGSAIQPPL